MIRKITMQVPAIPKRSQPIHDSITRSWASRSHGALQTSTKAMSFAPTVAYALPTGIVHRQKLPWTILMDSYGRTTNLVV